MHLQPFNPVKPSPDVCLQCLAVLLWSLLPHSRWQNPRLPSRVEQLLLPNRDCIASKWKPNMLWILLVKISAQTQINCYHDIIYNLHVFDINKHWIKWTFHLCFHLGLMLGFSLMSLNADLASLGHIGCWKKTSAKTAYGHFHGLHIFRCLPSSLKMSDISLICYNRAL